MLTDDAVPRLDNGGIALCHKCQRAVYFAGGFLALVLQSLENQIKQTRPAGTCPRCGATKLYFIKRYSRTRCGACHYEWSPTTGTAYAHAKKPREWYERIKELRGQGMSAYRISKTIGAADSKGVYEFVKRLESFGPMNPKLS